MTQLLWRNQWKERIYWKETDTGTIIMGHTPLGLMLITSNKFQENPVGGLAGDIDGHKEMDKKWQIL